MSGDDEAGDLTPLDPRVWTREKAMRANPGGSVEIVYGDRTIIAPLVDVQGAIEMLMSAPDRRQIVESINHSLRRDFTSAARGQASQQTAMHVMQDVALWFANEVIEGRAPLA